MIAEKVFAMGQTLVSRMQKEYAYMLRNVQGVVQNHYGFTREQRIAQVNESLQFLDNMSKQLNEEIAAYRESLVKFRDQ